MDNMVKAFGYDLESSLVVIALLCVFYLLSFLEKRKTTVKVVANRKR